MNSKSTIPNCFGGEPEKCPCTHRAKRRSVHFIRHWIAPKRILLSPLRLLAREIPTVINEFLDIVGIESQRTSAGSHFHSGKIWLALSRCMLYYPGNAHTEFLGNVAGLNQLPDGPHLSNGADNASVQVNAVDPRDQMLLQTSG
jgi:hypothetical protein